MSNLDWSTYLGETLLEMTLATSAAMISSSGRIFTRPSCSPKAASSATDACASRPSKRPSRSSPRLFGDERDRQANDVARATYGAPRSGTSGTPREVPQRPGVCCDDGLGWRSSCRTIRTTDFTTGCPLMNTTPTTCLSSPETNTA